MAPVRFPDFLAAQQPVQQGHGGIGNEGREREQRHPEWKQASAIAPQAARRRQEAERGRAGVAEEDSGQREVVNQESGAGRRDSQAERGESGIGPSQSGQRDEPDHGHPTSKAVHAVHEVIEIDHPDNEQERQRNGDSYGQCQGKTRQVEMGRCKFSRKQADSP